MNNKTPEESEQPVKKAILNAMNEKMENAELENDDGAPKATEKDGSISYASNSVRVADTVGTIVLGILSLFLLMALLSAHRRERKTIRKQARLS